MRSNCSYNLHIIHIRDIGRKLLGKLGSLRGLRIATIFNFLHILVMVLFFMQLFSRLRTHSRATGPRWSINSGRMSSIPDALLGEIQDITWSSSLAENGLLRREDGGLS